MSEASSSDPGWRAADWMCLAASPTFAIMALLTSSHGGSAPDTIRSAGHPSSLGGMAAMYCLMSAFHAAPWLKRIAGRRGQIMGQTFYLPLSRPPILLPPNRSKPMPAITATML